MRTEVSASIQIVWDQCRAYPPITLPDVTVDIYEDAAGQTQWRISHESVYSQYVESLLPVGILFPYEKAKLGGYQYISYSKLTQISHLRGRGRTAVVRICSNSETLYVFKGLDFGAFLDSGVGFEHKRNILYHEIRTITSLPKHPTSLLHYACLSPSERCRMITEP